jgi:hypothetical protein
MWKFIKDLAEKNHVSIVNPFDENGAAHIMESIKSLTPVSTDVIKPIISNENITKL